MYETEIGFGLILAAWILYELYGRTAMEWLAEWAMWIRIGAGVAILGYLYWQARAAPEQFTDTLGLAKQLLTDSTLSGFTAGSGAGTGSGTGSQKRNVSNLMKKKVAASQSWKCGNCSALLDETWEVDHKLALFKGGSNDESNLVALCPHCHRKKTVEERLT